MKHKLLAIHGRVSKTRRWWEVHTLVVVVGAGTRGAYSRSGVGDRLGLRKKRRTVGLKLIVAVGVHNDGVVDADSPWLHTRNGFLRHDINAAVGREGSDDDDRLRGAREASWRSVRGLSSIPAQGMVNRCARRSPSLIACLKMFQLCRNTSPAGQAFLDLRDHTIMVPISTTPLIFSSSNILADVMTSHCVCRSGKELSLTLLSRY